MGLPIAHKEDIESLSFYSPSQRQTDTAFVFPPFPCLLFEEYWVKIFDMNNILKAWLGYMAF